MSNTDHRAQAEHWLAQAETNAATYTDPDPDPAVLALIGIGHALLALSDTQAKPTINLTGQATREQIRDVLQRHGPPLSPSEG